MKLKEETPNPFDLWSGTYRVTNRDPYQSIDLIECYKSCIGQNKLGRGTDARGRKNRLSTFYFNLIFNCYYHINN